MKKIKQWLKDNKEDILVAWGTLATAIATILVGFCIIMVSITNDLVKKVQIQEGTMKELQFEAVYYNTLADELAQTYEDVVPKQQYIQDIEYLESVILELRTQCELECGTYNNKEN